MERIVAGEAAVAGFVSSRSTNLERARGILAQIVSQDHQDRDRALAIESSRTALEPLRLASSQRSSEQIEAEARVQDIQDAITAIRKSLDDLRVIRAQSNQLTQWDNELIGMKSQASQIASEAREAKAAADHHAKRRRVLQNLDNQLDECERRLAESQELRLKAELLADLEAPLFYVSQLDLLQRSLTEASTLITEFDLSLEQFHSQKQQAQQALEAARLTFDNVAGAVARIAEQLGDADCECPVCATTFEQNGELRRRAFEAVDRLAPSLVPFQEKLAEIQRLEAEVRRKRAEKHSEIETTRTQMTNIERDSDRRKELVEGIFGAAPETPIAIVLDGLSASVERLNDRVARLKARRNLPLLAGDGEPFVVWTAAVRRQNMLEGNLTSLVKDIEALEARIVTERTELATQTLNLESDVAALIADTELALAAQTEKLSAAREELESVSQAAKAASLALSQVEASLQAMLAEAQDSRNLLDALVTEWRSMEYLGDAINSEAIRSQDQMLAELAAALEFVRPLIARLRDGRRIWARQSNHKDTIEQLRSQLAAAPNLGRDGLREEADRVIAMCQNRISAIRKAKEIAQNATTEVNRKVQEFNSDFLKPLSALMNKINRAILSEPDIGLDLKVEKKKIAQTAIKSADAPEIVSKLNPQLVHSEGQMAALAVSMLCAANLSFPWCRWPALVMDDPLQHNDVIHAAAFADIMCNLVEARKQQIFLSTHDIAQAEFLRRKFGSRNIPCTSVHLLGRGRDGLEVQVKSYDGGSDAAAAAANS